jgi:hypothetical protein
MMEEVDYLLRFETLVFFNISCVKGLGVLDRLAKMLRLSAA